MLHVRTGSSRRQWILAVVMLLALTIPTISSGLQATQAEAANRPALPSDVRVANVDFQCIGNLVVLVGGTAALVVGASAAPPAWIVLVGAGVTAWQVYQTALSCQENTPPDGCIAPLGFPWPQSYYTQGYCSGGGGGGGGGGGW